MVLKCMEYPQADGYTDYRCFRRKEKGQENQQSRKITEKSPNL